MILPKITLQKLALESGYTEDALRSKIARGEFAEGIHYIKAPDGRIHFIVEAYLIKRQNHPNLVLLEWGEIQANAQNPANCLKY